VREEVDGKKPKGKGRVHAGSVSLLQRLDYSPEVVNIAGKYSRIVRKIVGVSLKVVKVSLFSFRLKVRKEGRESSKDITGTKGVDTEG
jgi:hypothetical protein